MADPVSYGINELQMAHLPKRLLGEAKNALSYLQHRKVLKTLNKIAEHNLYRPR